MAVVEDFHQLLQKEVSRQDFLRYVGVAILSFIGVMSVLENVHKAFGGGNQNAKLSSAKPAEGYGISAYGR